MVCVNVSNGESEVKNKLLSTLLFEPIRELNVKLELLCGPERLYRLFVRTEGLL